MCPAAVQSISSRDRAVESRADKSHPGSAHLSPLIIKSIQTAGSEGDACTETGEGR